MLSRGRDCSGLVVDRGLEAYHHFRVAYWAKVESSLPSGSQVPGVIEVPLVAVSGLDYIPKKESKLYPKGKRSSLVLP